MTDENANTADLTSNEKLDQVLRKLGDLDARLATLEARAEDRARETRPKLDTIIKELADLREGQKDAAARSERVEARLDRIEKQLKIMTQDVMQVRTDQQSLEDRMSDLERRPN